MVIIIQPIHSPSHIIPLITHTHTHLHTHIYVYVTTHMTHAYLSLVHFIANYLSNCFFSRKLNPYFRHVSLPPSLPPSLCLIFSSSHLIYLSGVSTTGVQESAKRLDQFASVIESVVSQCVCVYVCVCMCV